MANNHLNPNPFAETALRFRNRRWWIGLFLAFNLSVASLIYTVHGLLPLPAYYFRAYLAASFGFSKSQTVSFAEVLDHGRVVLALPPDVVVAADGHLVLSPVAVQYGRQPLRFTERTVPTGYLYSLLRDWIYRGAAPPTILFPAGITTLLSFILLPTLGAILDAAARKRRRDGVLRRGPKLLSRHEFNRALSSDGVGFETRERPNFSEFLLAPFWRRGHFRRSPLSLAIGPLIGRGMIRIPAKKETNHILLVGATGTGKSQLLTQYLLEIQDRGETAVIYDPDGEFLAQFYNKDRGDIVLNPRDSRCPYWAPSHELASNIESYPLAESLFSDPPKPDEKNTFFVRAPRLILARLFEHNPTPGQLIDWLKHKAEIDKRVKNSELEELLSKSAGPQRSGVLASLAMALNAFRLLPTPEGRAEWSALSWSEKRDGWIFITSDEQTRSIQLPLITMWIDTLFRRLMARPDPATPPRPVWFIIDELASMRRLPSLQDALTRARKYQLKTIFGFQSFSQMQELYGQEGAKTILGMPGTGIYLRTKDPDAADWVSRTLGEQEFVREKANVGYRGSVFTQKTVTYSIAKETERVASASQIQELPDLTGYIQFNDAINRFRIRATPRPHSLPAFLPRDTSGFVPLSDDEYTLMLDASAEELPLSPEDRKAAEDRPQGGGSSLSTLGVAIGQEATSHATPKTDSNELQPPDFTKSTVAATAATTEAVELASQAIRSGQQVANVPSLSNLNSPAHAHPQPGPAHVPDPSPHSTDGHPNMVPSLGNVGDVAAKLLETVDHLQGNALQKAEEIAEQEGVQP